MSRRDDRSTESDPGEYVRRVHEETQQFTHDLLRENGNLRGQIAGLESTAKNLQEQVRIAREQIAALQGVDAEMRHRLFEIEAGARQHSAHSEELEQQNFNLMSLYVASYRLHGTLDHQEVIATIQEILSNLVGAEELALFALDEGATALRLHLVQGIDSRRFETIRVGQGIIGGVVASGISFFARQDGANALAGDEANLNACVPLRVADRITGAIAVFRLLPQKPCLKSVDHELLNLLATHAAMALHCTELHARFCMRSETAA